MITGVILAGGENWRMGGNMKALLSFGEETLLERQISAMQTLCREVIIVTNQPAKLSHLQHQETLKIITDDIPGKGPLSGIHAAALRAKEEDLWVVACDMPYISPQAAEILLAQQKQNDHDAAVPFIDGITQPLHGTYKRSTAPTLQQLLQNGQYKVQSFLDEMDWVSVPEDLFFSQNIDPRFIMNLNTPQEFEQALKMHSK